MSDLIWLNGQIMPLAEARVSVEDRGFQFADGVYEVVRVYNARPFTLDEHLDRLERSCGGISLEMSMSRADLSREMGKLIEKAGLKEGMIYLQVTRGCAPRNHVFTKCQPTVLFYTRVLPAMVKPNQTKGLRLVSVPDERWSRCWVKSIGLVANVLAKNTAIAAGADEAVFVQGGMVTECSTSNIFIVSRGSLLTHPVGPKVLPGITRLVLLEVAKELGIPVMERPISEGEVLAAEEVFITSTTRELAWVAQWNNQPVGSGRCGAISLRLHEAYQKRVEGACY